jgi:cell volume regulation protein A
LVEVTVPPGSPAVGKTLLELALPAGALIVLIQRDGDVLVPRGGTPITESDTLLVLADNPALGVLKSKLNS